MVKINELTLEYAKDVENPILNFELGLAFYKEGHAPSALNFFLRSAELFEDDEMVYKSLLYCAICLHSLGERPHSVKGFLLHAISIIPQRPEAWFMYVRSFKENRDWQECFTNSVNCLRNCDFRLEIIEGSGYKGPQDFLFFQAISGYQFGRFDEVKKVIVELVESYWVDMSYEQRKSVKSHIILLGMVPDWMKKIINC